MIKYEIDIKQMIMKAYSEREISLKEYRDGLKYCDKCDIFTDTLNEKQKDQFNKLEDLRTEYEVEEQYRLLNFVFDFINTVRN